ncbi:MAG TPA: hypothetical protein P5089_00075 [Candidatus Portnoybacteria bacterium]|nr:hypothetical protein [Candidatus Portnoybacteria bacterium]
MTNLSFYPGDDDQDQKGTGLADDSTDEAPESDTDEPEMASGEDEDDFLDDGIVEGEEIE